MFKIIKKNSKLLIYSALFFVFVFVFSLNNSFSYLDADLGWHLRAGGDIFTQKAVTLDNLYNYTLQSEEWVNHEWLLDLAAFLVFDSYGYVVLNILFAIFVTIIFFLLLLWFKKTVVHKSPTKYFAFFFFSVLGILAISPHIGVRMQVLGLLLFLLLLMILNSYSKNRSWKTLIWLPILFVIWANIHASFLLGLAILGFWFAVKILERIFYNWSLLDFLDFSQKMTIRQAWTFVCFGFASLLATLINPYGLKLYEFLGGYKNSFYLSHIQEWLPQYHLPIMYWQLVYLGIFLAFLIIVILERKNKPIKLNPWLLALSILLFIFSFKSKRHFPLFFISSLPVITYLFACLFEDIDKYLQKDNLKKFVSVKFITIFSLFTYLMVLAGFIVDTRFINQPFNNNYCHKFPCQAVNLIMEDEQLRDLKILNHYGWGGYLIWLWPEKQLFIDGRMPQLEYKEHTILEEYFEFFDEETVELKLQEYEIELILMPKEIEPQELTWYEEKVLGVKENKERNPFYKFLDESEDWKNIFNDHISTVYVKEIE